MTDHTYNFISEDLEGELPVGPNMRDGDGLARYREVKSLRADARADDRRKETDLDLGDETGEQLIAISPIWRELHDAAANLLRDETKDTELLVWLAEAAVRTKGLEAFCQIMMATADLVEKHGTALNGPEEDDETVLFTPFSALGGTRGGDGTVVRPLRLVPLFAGETFGTFSHFSYTRALDRIRVRDKAEEQGKGISARMEAENEAGVRVRDDMHQMIANLEPGRFEILRDTVRGGIDAVKRIETFLNESYGANAPSLRQVSEVLQELSGLLNELSRFAVSLPAEAEAQSDGQDEDAPHVESAVSATAQAPATGAVQNREQAFKQMLQIADFFRRTEPHSGIPFALETIVRRGRMSYMSLIAELLPDESQRREFFIRAGIEPRSDNDGSEE